MNKKEYDRRFAGRTTESKIIIDLCGGTGRWGYFYKVKGYTVYNITLPDYDVMSTFLGPSYPGWLHFHGESALSIEISKVYGILAAPDCQHFSFARNRANTERDIPGAFEIVQKCREIIEVCALYGNLKFWALENPRGYLERIIGKPHYTFQRFWYGDPGIKNTGVWGNFEIPKPKPKLELRDPDFIMSGCLTKVTIPGGYRKKGQDGKRIKRAMTPPGFAKAFFEANK